MTAAPADDTERRALAVRLTVAVVFGMMTMALALVTYLTPFGPLGAGEQRALGWAMAILSVPVVIGSGSNFAREAWNELASRRPGMSTLVTLGTASAYVYSWWALLTGVGDVYFDTAAMLVVFLLVGRLIESRLARSAQRALDGWLASLPTTATLRRNGVCEAVDVASVARGTEIVVRGGEMVPLDGRVVEGHSDLDRAALNGESAPVQVGPGALVEAGTINLSGRLCLRVTGTVGRRVVDQLVRSVQACARERPRVQRLADRFAQRLVYAAIVIAAAVLVIGIATTGLEPALMRALAVLVVACPCVAGLATPAAIAAAAVGAARGGVVIKSADALERLARADTVVFDKTGTLTLSRMCVTDIVAAPGWQPGAVLAWAAAVEAGIAHPIADAITARAAGVDRPEVHEIRVMPGRGATARGQSGPVVVGNAALLASHGAAPRGAAWEAADARANATVSWTHVVVAGRWIGALALLAPLRPGVRAALAAARSDGLRLRISTGDTPSVAQAIGRQLDLAPQAIEAALDPDAKAQSLRTLQQAGHATVYVGDGINDGPVLAAADVGVAVADATAVAEAAAHVVLTRGGAERVPELMNRARRAYRVMRTNLGWAVAYNLIALPFAALGHVPPGVAAAMMVASSTLVLANSSRLMAGPRVASSGGPAAPRRQSVSGLARA